MLVIFDVEDARLDCFQTLDAESVEVEKLGIRDDIGIIEKKLVIEAIALAS